VQISGAAAQILSVEHILCNTVPPGGQKSPTLRAGGPNTQGRGRLLAPTPLARRPICLLSGAITGMRGSFWTFPYATVSPDAQKIPELYVSGNGRSGRRLGNERPSCQQPQAVGCPLIPPVLVSQSNSASGPTGRTSLRDSRSPIMAYPPASKHHAPYSPLMCQTRVARSKRPARPSGATKETVLPV